MASLHASLMLSSSSSSSSCKRGIMTTLQAPKLGKVPMKNTTTKNMVEGFLSMETQYTQTLRDNKEDSTVSTATSISQLYLIADEVANRVEMHTNMGEQRDNWNTLFLTSINTITLTAATMAALPFPSLNLSYSLLFSAAAGMMVVMNKIQPSQLTEEQRNAVKLFKQLHRAIQTSLAIATTPTARDVKGAMEKVLALDRAYPLPLLGVMFDKCPATVEPAKWWPSPSSSPSLPQGRRKRINVGNGWSEEEEEEEEEEMREIVRVMKRKDAEEYMRLGKLVLKMNKILAISGPLLAGVAAVGSALENTYDFNYIFFTLKYKLHGYI